MSKAKRASDEGLWRAARAVTSLKYAHEALVRVMPAPDADPAVRRTFFLRSADVYARVAEIDRGHHHEALYWAKREREKGEAIDAGRAGDRGADR
ncbi:AMED_5909 family protein [Saccharothrix hoggarensis]|uniref:AMED_5909 family protein n=1 Tax=Saccharothrix hoggarensis TaxID=913853 RepID=A0ABW3QTG5_9PSEU